MSTLAKRRRRRSRTMGEMGEKPTLVGSIGRRRRRYKSMGAGIELLGSFGRRKKGRKVCVRVGKRTYCGRPVAAPKRRRRRRKR